MTTDIAVLGAAFNPPTLGHADVIEQLLERFNQILLVPSISHAFGKKMLPFVQRTEMLQLFIADKFPHNVHIETIEQQLFTQGAVYSFDVLEALEKKYSAPLVLVLGPDNLEAKTFQRFHRYQELQQRWRLFAAQQRRDIRSTHVRQRIAENAQADISDLTSPSVIHYIQQHGLYQT